MKWLITTKSNADLSRIVKELAAWGCVSQNWGMPIPLGDEEQVIEVEGPPNLPEIAVQDNAIIKVSPSSELTLYSSFG